MEGQLRFRVGLPGRIHQALDSVNIDVALCGQGAHYYPVGALSQQVTYFVHHGVHVRGGVVEIAGAASHQRMDLKAPGNVFNAGFHESLAWRDATKFQAAAELNPIGTFGCGRTGTRRAHHGDFKFHGETLRAVTLQLFLLVRSEPEDPAGSFCHEGQMRTGFDAVFLCDGVLDDVVKIKAGPLDGTNPNLHHCRDVAVFQSPHVPDFVLYNQRHDALFNIIEEGRRWFCARQASTPWRSENRNSGFFQHPYDLHIVDMPIRIHVTPAHRYEYL